MANNLLKKLNRPVGKEAKAKLDEWLNTNINIPMAEKGHEDFGAGIAGLLSATGEMLIPDDLADAAMAMVPGAKVFRSAQKGMKVIKKVQKAAPPLDYKDIAKASPPKSAKGKPSALNYSDIDKAEKAKAKSARKLSEDSADTLSYDKSGKITRKKADLDEDWAIPKTK